MRFQVAFSSIKNKLKAEQQQTRCILFELLSFLGDDSSKHLNKHFFPIKKNNNDNKNIPFLGCNYLFKQNNQNGANNNGGW